MQVEAMKQLVEGDHVHVNAFGKWRPGVVVKVGRTRVKVRYARSVGGAMEHERSFEAADVFASVKRYTGEWDAGHYPVEDRIFGRGTPSSPYQAAYEAEADTRQALRQAAYERAVARSAAQADKV